MSVRSLLMYAVMVTVAAASVTMPTAATAVEQERHTIRTTDDNPGGTVTIAERGDVMRVCDTDADGRGAEVKVSWPGRVYILTADEEGNCTTRDASWGQLYDIPENATVWTTVSLDGSPDFHKTLVWRNDH